VTHVATNIEFFYLFRLALAVISVGVLAGALVFKDSPAKHPARKAPPSFEIVHNLSIDPPQVAGGDLPLGRDATPRATAPP